MVGGGAAGVEMAAEIKTEYPAKEVALCYLQKTFVSKPVLVWWSCWRCVISVHTRSVHAVVAFTLPPAL